MWVRRVAESVTIRKKQFHACDSSEIATRTKTELRQARIYAKRKQAFKETKQTILPQEKTQKATEMHHKAWEAGLPQNN